MLWSLHDHGYYVSLFRNVLVPFIVMLLVYNWTICWRLLFCLFVFVVRSVGPLIICFIGVDGGLVGWLVGWLVDVMLTSAMC